MRLNIFKRAPQVAATSVESTSPSISIEKLDYFDGEETEALDVVADMLYRSCLPLGWLPAEQVDTEDWTDEVTLGIVIKTSNGAMRACPVAHDGMVQFEDAAISLKVAAAIKLRSRAVEYMFKHFM